MRHPLLIITMALMMSSCVKYVNNTDIHIIDPDRHYYAVVQGEDVRMAYRLVNVGNSPLVISDIQPATPDIELYREAPKVVPVHDSVTLQFVYHTHCNISYTEHLIRIFGNIATVNGVRDTLQEGVALLHFDINIVRPTLDGSDHEEWYYRHRPRWEDLVDGTRGEQGYYTDADVREREEEREAENKKEVKE